MDNEPSEQPDGSCTSRGEEAAPREMTLLDMALRQAAEILKTISIHAEYPTHIIELTQTITQRILPATQPLTETPKTDDRKNSVLQDVVRTMERLTSRIDAMETRALQTSTTQATSRSWADEMDTMVDNNTPTAQDGPKRNTRKDTPTTSIATSKPITPRPRREPLPRPAVTNPLAAYHPSRLDRKSVV